MEFLCGDESTFVFVVGDFDLVFKQLEQINLVLVFLDILLKFSSV